MAEGPDVPEQTEQIGEEETHQIIDERQIQKTGEFLHSISHLPSQFQELHQATITKKYTKCSQVNIMLTGLTGSGKSTLGNAFLGQLEQDRLEEGSDVTTHCTREATSKKIATDKELKVLIWDTPGLKDGTRGHHKYLDQIAEVIKHYGKEDILLYCIKADARWIASKDNNDVKVMMKLNKKLGKRIWERTIFVITYANLIQHCFPGVTGTQLEEQFKKKISAYQTQIATVLRKYLGVHPNVAENILAIPAGHYSEPHLPGWEYWFSYLWLQCLNSMSIEGRRSLVNFAANRIVDQGSETQQGLQRGQIVLTEKFLPEKLLKAKKQGKIKGGLIGLLGGPLFLITVPVGVYAGGKMAEDDYTRKIAQ